MRRVMIFVLLVWIAAAGTSCAGPAAAAPPELIRPVGIKADTAVVERGDVFRLNQIKGFIRVRSDKLSYGETGLRFGEYTCVCGQWVEEGQLLAKLDTENLEKQIKSQEEEIAHQLKENAFEIEGLELDIALARAEAAALSSAASQYDEAAMRAREEKTLAIERMILNLSQTRERHALSLQYAQAYLDTLLEQLKGSELRAPYAGYITYREPKFPGDYVEPFAPLLYISDEKETFVEYASLTQVTVTKNNVVVGYVGDKAYQLERISIPAQDLVYYNTNRLMAPLRFQIVDSEDTLAPGTLMTIHVYDFLAEDVLRIPTNALYTDAELGFFVYVVDRGQKTMRSVEIGYRTQVHVEVTSGLSEGEVVYVK